MLGTQVDVTSIIDTIILAGVALVTSYVGIRASKTGKTIEKQASQIAEVHTLVNANLTDSISRRDVAEAKLDTSRAETKAAETKVIALEQQRDSKSD